MFILHVSDTHLGAMPGGLLSRAKDVYEVFRETIDIALKEHVDLYMHTGDFFNSSTPPPEAYIVAYRGLKKLKERNIKVIAIAGQHDIPKRYAVSPLAILKDIGAVDIAAIDSVISEELHVDNRKLLIYCVPHPFRNKLPSITSPKDVKSVVMAHLLLKDIGIPSPEADISLDMFPLGFRYIALGDYHVRTVFRHKDGTPAVYPGATEVHRVSENGEKYVALVDLSKDEATVSFIELQNVRPWVVLKCSEVSNCVNSVLEKSKSILSRGKKKPLVYILIEKMKTEVLSRHLDDMIYKGFIEYYTLTSHEEKGEGEADVYSHSYLEHLEHIDVAKILIDTLGEETVASRLLELIEDPSKQSAEDLVNLLRDNEHIVKELEARLKRLAIQQQGLPSSHQSSNDLAPGLSKRNRSTLLKRS